ncbi:MAG: response regulator transcription factor [Granulosicoccus sp.]
MNILAIDDHELFRTGLKHLLKGIENDIDFTSVGSVEEAESLRGQVAPDLILLDYFLNGVQGDEALLKVRQAFPKAVVVVISSLDDSHLIKLAIEHGAAGFIPKSSSQTALINALRLILDGGVYLPRHAIFGEHIVEQKWSSTTEDHGDIDILSKLTVRQKEVV